MNNQYIGARKIVGISDLEKKSPAGAGMVHVIFEVGSAKDMPKILFDLTVTDIESDASAVGQKIRKQVGSMIFSLMNEYGVSLSQANVALDEAATLVNSAMDKATNILYGVEYPDDRTLLQINEILLENAKNTGQIPVENSDVASPEGSESH